MRIRTTGIRKLFLMGVASLLVISACAPAAAPAPAAPAAPVNPKAPVPAAAPVPALAAPAPAPAPAPASTQPKYGGTFSFSYGSNVTTHLDPILITTAFTHHMVSNIYERLVVVNWEGTPNNPIIKPGLAERWEVSKDGLTLTFYLRKGVKWQNIPPVNGRELTSADVKFSLERAAYDPASLFQATYRNVDKFETPDKYSFVIKMKSYDPELLTMLSAHHGWVVPKEVVDRDKNLKTTAIGTGPFILDKWVKDVGMFFKKNPDYWKTGRPYVDKIEMPIVADPQTQKTAFRTGKLCCWSGGIVDFQDVQKTNPDIRYVKYLITQPNVVGMHFRNPIFKDIRVRKAIFLAMDHSALIKVGADGDGLWRGPVSGQHEGWALSQEELKRLMPYDPAQARQLLKESGYAQGLTMEMLHNASYPQYYQGQTQLLIEEFKAIGITIKLDSYPHAVMRAKQDSGEYKDLIYGPDGQLTPLTHLTMNYRTGGNKNMMQLNDPDLDKRIDDAVSTVDVEQQRKKVLDIQRWLLQNYYYKVPIYDSYTYDMSHPWVHGVKATPPHFYVGNYTDIAEVWVEK